MSVEGRMRKIHDELAAEVDHATGWRLCFRARSAANASVREEAYLHAHAETCRASLNSTWMAAAAASRATVADALRNLN